MQNAHIISHFAATAARYSALADKVRGNLDLMIAAEQRASEARAYFLAEQAPVAVVADPDVEAGACAYRSADRADKRCPFRRPERVAAWLRGFNGQHANA